MRAEDYKISSEKFTFHSTGENIHDTKLETKPVTYFRDALNRFAKNKASILAFGIIVILVLFAVIVPIFTPYEVSYSDAYYRFLLPKNQLFVDLGLGFWDGTSVQTHGEANYHYIRAIGEETGMDVIVGEPVVYENEEGKKTYDIRVDSYVNNGFINRQRNIPNL